jgi:hypothetical protein
MLRNKPTWLPDDRSLIMAYEKVCRDLGNTPEYDLGPVDVVAGLPTFDKVFLVSGDQDEYFDSYKLQPIVQALNSCELV